MPVLQSGAETRALQTGTYTLGGRGPNALPLASLENSPEAAMIVVPPSGAATIQRLTASIVVRLDQTAIGIAPKVLSDGVEIEFNGCRLTFRTDDTGEATLTSTPADEAQQLDRLDSESPAFPQEPTAPAGKMRIVNVRTGDATDLGAGRVVVGRDDTCNIVLPGMGVSRRHCSIAPVQGGYLLRDESANGTLVNGSRISGTYLLDHGDIVRVCDEELRFEVEGSASSATITTAKATEILDVSRLRSEQAADGTQEWPAAPLAACLEIIRGPFAGASFSIDRPVCSIGRAAENDVRIRDESVSSTHATLLRKGGAWFVVDLRSANGTFVDGSRVAGERELVSGSRLKLGRVEMAFRAIEVGVEPATATKRRPWPVELLKSLFSRKSRTALENA